MKRCVELSKYTVLAMLVIGVDRITKYIALTWSDVAYPINKFLSFDVLINRGVSWGMFHAESTPLFLLVSVLVGLVIIALISYTRARFVEHAPIIGEVLVLASAASNMFDRVKYHGVVDFIVLSVGSYTFPVFNVADVFIIVGIIVMTLSAYRTNHA